jgi:hypothetical protein
MTEELKRRKGLMQMKTVTMEKIAIQSREMLLPLWREYGLTPPHTQIYYNVLKDKHFCQFAFSRGKIECEINLDHGIDIQIPPDIEEKLQDMLKKSEELTQRKPFVRLDNDRKGR